MRSKCSVKADGRQSSRQPKRIKSYLLAALLVIGGSFMAFRGFDNHLSGGDSPRPGMKQEPAFWYQDIAVGALLVVAGIVVTASVRR